MIIEVSIVAVLCTTLKVHIENVGVLLVLSIKIDALVGLWRLFWLRTEPFLIT